jgi:hypothetical protein
VGWVGLILTVVMGLAGIPLIRDWVCARLKIDEKLFSTIRIVLVFVGAIIAGTALYQKSQEVSDLRTKLANTAEVARQAQKVLEEKQRAEAEAEEKRRTPPKFLADLKARAPQNLWVAIISENLIPFEYEYVIVSMNNEPVSPLMLDWTKLFPTEQNRHFYSDVNVNWERVKDKYLELQFRFRSLAPDLFKESGHEGRIIKKYRVDDNGVPVLVE